MSDSNGTALRISELGAELARGSRLNELGQMAAALAQEVDQPLIAIAGDAAGARRKLAEGDQDGARQAMERIAEQAGRARQVVQRLREFARRGETERLPENLPRAIEEATALALIGTGPGISLDMRFDPDAEEAVIDRAQIQQILVNLVRNAVEAMADSPRRELGIATTCLGAMVEISVADTGPGLPESVRPRLFQPFVTTKPDGMGVGLSICRAIAEAHGGDLRVEDAIGGGAIFRLALPRYG